MLLDLLLFMIVYYVPKNLNNTHENLKKGSYNYSELFYRIVTDISLVLGFKSVENHCSMKYIVTQMWS